MEHFKTSLYWIGVIIISPFLIMLAVIIWGLFFLSYEIGYWLGRPYDRLLDFIEDLFSGGRDYEQ
jgi:membrane-bound acyltransferase YfiQ involved in biofilm formation